MEKARYKFLIIIIINRSNFIVYFLFIGCLRGGWQCAQRRLGCAREEIPRRSIGYLLTLLEFLKQGVI